MSISIIAATLASQLCYLPEHDLGDKYWLKKSNLLEHKLTVVVENKKTSCIELTTQAELEEANWLVKLDHTKKTLVLKSK